MTRTKRRIDPFQMNTFGTARAAAAGGSPVGVARGLSRPGASSGRGGRDRRAAELRGAAAVPTRGRGLGGPLITEVTS